LNPVNFFFKKSFTPHLRFFFTFLAFYKNAFREITIF
jgi:hypothetical protein